MQFDKRFYIKTKPAICYCDEELLPSRPRMLKDSQNKQKILLHKKVSAAGIKEKVEKHPRRPEPFFIVKQKGTEK